GQPLAPQALHVDPLLPVDRVQSVGADPHGLSPRDVAGVMTAPYERVPEASSNTETHCSVGVTADDALDREGGLRAGVAEPVRGGRREADRVVRAQLVGVEADVDYQAAGQDVAELLAGVAHERALARGAGAGLVGDVQELHPW